MRDQFKFLGQWAKNPLEIAAVSPSGQALARLMTKDIRPGLGPIIELGPGTGVFTRAAIGRGVLEEHIAMIELNPTFAEALSAQHPKAQIHNASATELQTMRLFGREAGMVLSGLGLLSMPRHVVEAILVGAFDHLRPGGAFVQFTYGLRCPVAPDLLQQLGLEAHRIGWTWRNLPPATVYKITKTRSGMVSTSDRGIAVKGQAELTP